MGPFQPYQTLPHPIRACNDLRKFHSILLPNQLQVTLIEDNSVSTASASLTIGVGHFCDPPEITGLAHLVEHLVAGGYRDFPGQETTPRYFQKYSCYSIASTGDQMSEYTMEMPTGDESEDVFINFSSVISLFAKMFVKPAFSEEGIEREVISMEAEFQNSRLHNHEHRSVLQAYFINPAHPLSNYVMGGNKRTLRTNPQSQNIDVLAAVHDFFNKYYSANLMKLCVVTPFSTAKILPVVASLFSNIANQNTPDPALHVQHIPLHLPDSLGREFRIQTFAEKNTLTIHWNITPDHLFDQTQSDTYVLKMLSFKGDGSLANTLRNKRLIYKMVVGAQVSWLQRNYHVQLLLTDLGSSRIADIIEIFFQYIELIKNIGVTFELYNDKRTSSFHNFKYQMDGPLDQASEISLAMHILPTKDIVLASNLFRDYKPHHIHMFLSTITPESIRVFISGRSAIIANSEDIKTLSEYDLTYSSEKFSWSTIQKWTRPQIKNDLRLFGKNPWVSSDVELIERVFGVEAHLIQTSAHGIATLRGIASSSPVGDLRVRLCLNSVLNMPFYHLMTKIFLTHLNHEIGATSYMALESGSSIGLTETIYGLDIVLVGYTRFLPDIFSRVIRALKDCQPGYNDFMAAKAELQSELSIKHENCHTKGHLRAMEHATVMVDRSFYTTEFVRKFVLRTSYAEYKKFRQGLFQRVKFTATAMGNYNLESLVSLAESIPQVLQSEPFNAIAVGTPHACALKLPNGEDFYIRKGSDINTDKVSALSVYFQAGDLNEVENGMVDLVRILIQEPIYHHFRIANQLCYFLDVVPLCTHGVFGLRIDMLSPVADPDELLHQLELFIDAFVDDLHTRFTDLSWSLFQQRIRTANNLLSRESVFNFIVAHLCPGYGRRRVISQVFAKNHQKQDWDKLPAGATDASLVRNPREVSRNLDMYPAPDAELRTYFAT